MNPTLLRVDRLTVTYSAAVSVTPIRDVSFEVSPGRIAVILGPSGCGKTSLLACLGGLLRPASGTISVGDTDVTALSSAQLDAYRRGTVGIVFQAFNVIPSLSALENVMVPLRADGQTKRAAQARAAELLERVGLSDRAKHRPSELSGGQMQRVAIARALALAPPFIVADEPTANLDQAHVGSTIELLRSLSTDGSTVVIASHDQRVVEVADQVLDLTPPRPQAMGPS